MNNDKINGAQYARMLLGGAALLSEHVDEVNNLNVFPVPDGDTGTNMYKTIEGGISEISKGRTESIGSLAKSFAHGALLYARGNSGVILSQIFAGIGEELSKYDSVDALSLAAAFKSGIRKAYSAVQNPTEGTILTVFREASEYACEMVNESSSVVDFFKLHIEKAKESLLRTKELLPILAEADVVDSGGAGYLYIVLGMYQVLTGALEGELHILPEAKEVSIDNFTRDSVLEFGYCTEFLLRLTTNKVDPDSFEIDTVLKRLNELKGESIVAYKEGDVVKVHVHTHDPGSVLTMARDYGEFLTVKVENMSLEHSGEKRAKKPYAVIAVASGEGFVSLFKDMGVDGIVSGGQSNNPSIEEFIKEFDRCNAENIIVLPNNKNVILAAKQAKELYSKANVHIIPTRNLMQGYGALSVITPGITDIATLVSGAERAANTVCGIEITRAVRNVTIGGKEVKLGDYISISDGDITAVADSAERALIYALEKIDMDEYELITLFTGKDVSCERRAALTEEIEELYPDCELTVYEGGQEMYDYYVAIE